MLPVSIFIRTVTFICITVIILSLVGARIIAVVEIWWSQCKSIQDFNQTVQLRVDGLGNDATDHDGTILEIDFSETSFCKLSSFY